MNNRKPLFGVGINDADYSIRRTERYTENGKVKSRTLWFCPYYKRWADMIKRCYSEKFTNTNVTYKGCSVCEEWLYFSNFKAWMEQQDWEGKYLDKDFIGDGKLYSPETCRFITNELNTFISPFSRLRGEYPIGVHLDKSRGKFKSEIKIGCRSKFLGYFYDELDAHKAWQQEKIKVAKNYASIVEDLELGMALQKIINKLESDIVNNLVTTTHKQVK